MLTRPASGFPCFRLPDMKLSPAEGIQNRSLTGCAANGYHPRPADVKTPVANGLGAWKYITGLSYKAPCTTAGALSPKTALTPVPAVAHGTACERPAADRQENFSSSRRAALPDARFPTDPDSRPMPTGNRHGVQGGFSKQGPGKSRLPMVSNPFPDHTFARSIAFTFSERSCHALPARSRSPSPDSQSLPRVPTIATDAREAATGDASDLPATACSAPS